MPPRGHITFSPDAKPIEDFIAAANAALDSEYARLPELGRYDPTSADAHAEYERLREEENGRLLDLGVLAAAALRAGRLAGATVETAELVDAVMDCIRKLRGWVGEWWSRHDADCRERRWRRTDQKEVEAPWPCGKFPPQFIDSSLPALTAVGESLSPLTNRLAHIALAVPLIPDPPSAGLPRGLPAPKIDREVHAIALLFKHPEWSVAQIADYLEVDRKAPYKWKKFRAAAEKTGLLKPRGRKDRAPHSGHKTRDGRVEAYDDEGKDE